MRVLQHRISTRDAIGKRQLPREVFVSSNYRGIKIHSLAINDFLLTKVSVLSFFIQLLKDILIEIQKRELFANDLFF